MWFNTGENTVPMTTTQNITNVIYNYVGAHFLRSLGQVVMNCVSVYFFVRLYFYLFFSQGFTISLRKILFKKMFGFKGLTRNVIVEDCVFVGGGGCS